MQVIFLGLHKVKSVSISVLQELYGVSGNQMKEGFKSHHMTINTISPLHYSLNGPHLDMNRIHQTRYINNMISPMTPVARKMDHYKALFLHLSPDGSIVEHLVRIHISQALDSVIGKLRISPYQLEIETASFSKG